MPDAHADYEVPMMTVSDAQGAPLRVVRHFKDGIFTFDPVKIVIYDAEDKAVAETAFHRYIIVPRKEGKDLKMYGVGFPLHRDSIHFPRNWVLVDRTLIPNKSLRVYFDSLFAILRKSWFGYTFSILLCTAAAQSCLSAFRASGTIPTGGTATAWLAAIWLILNFAYGHLSISIIMSLSLFTSLLLTRNLDEALRVTVVLVGGAIIGPLLVITLDAMVRSKDRKAGTSDHLARK